MGYDPTPLFAIAQTPQIVQADSQVNPGASIARKCTISNRQVDVTTGILPEDALPPGITQDQSDWFSFRNFLYDFGISCAHHEMSKGYLVGLEPFVLALGTSSSLAKACAAVGYASHARPLNRPSLARRADQLSRSLVSIVAHALNRRDGSKNTEVKIIVLLLGLHQIMITHGDNFGNHMVHLNGLLALHNKTASFKAWMRRDFLEKHIFHLPRKPNTNVDEKPHLDDMILEIYDVWMGSCKATSIPLLQRILSLQRQIERWNLTIVQEARPAVLTMLSSVSHNGNDSYDIGYWPGEVHTFLDPYSAGIWNVYRAAHLLVLDMALEHCNALVKDKIQASILRLTKDIIASIPYLLAENVYAFVAEASSSKAILRHGRVLGGLLLMHPLYVATRISCLPLGMAEYLRRTLKWIDMEMGIGQAGVLAEATNIDLEYLLSGFMLVWHGMRVNVTPGASN